MYKFPEETLKALRENRIETLDLGPLGFKGRATLSEHKAHVWSLASLPDGRLASGSLDKTIRLWNVRSGVCEATLSGHKAHGWSLASLPDGRLASGSDDKTIHLWNVRSGEYEATLSGHMDTVLSLALLADGRLASGSRDNMIRLWNVRIGECEAILSGHEDSVTSLAVLLDGRLASGSADRTIRLWNVSSGRCEAILSGRESVVNSLAMLADGRLASGSRDNTIRLWDVRSGVCEATLSGHTGSVHSLALLLDGRLASGSHDKTIRLWNVRSGICEAILSGHESYMLSLTVLPDGRLAAGEFRKFDASDAYITLWPIAPDKSLFLGLKSALESNNTLKKIEWSGCESLFNDEEHAWLNALLKRNQASKIALLPLPPAPKIIAAPEVTKPAAGGVGVTASDAASELAKLRAELAALKAKPAVASIFTLIPSKDLIFSEKLGEGSFGAVYKGKWNEKNVALKKLLVEVLSKEEEAEFKGEALLQAGLHHENIVELIGICLERAKYTLVMELMPKGSLYAVLKNGDLPWSVKLSIAKDIANGLSYLHELSILHRDLKSLNVLLDDRMRAKLCDFGYTAVKSGSVLATASSAIGTKLWMAPELFKRGSRYTEQSDLFALGVIFWELATRKLPFVEEAGSLDRAIEWVKDGEREKIPAGTPPKLASLIAHCWAHKVEDRPASVKVVLEELMKEAVGGGAGAAAHH